MIEKSVGIRIQERRKACGLTQEQLAEKIDLSPNHLSAIERGVYSIKLDTLVQIINCLGCTADDLFCDVIDSGYKNRASRLTDMLEGLKPEEQSNILDVVQTMIRNAK